MAKRKIRIKWIMRVITSVLPVSLIILFYYSPQDFNIIYLIDIVALIVIMTLVWSYSVEIDNQGICFSSLFWFLNKRINWDEIVELKKVDRQTLLTYRSKKDGKSRGVFLNIINKKIYDVLKTELINKGFENKITE